MRTLLLALALLLAVPVTASAAGGLKPIAPGSGLKPVPPSNSAANQYVEVVPTAGGGAPASGITRRSSGSGSGSASGSALPAQTRTALAGSGQDGQRVAQLTQATAPTRVRTHGKTTKHAGAVVGPSGSSGGGGGTSGTGSTPATPVSSVVKSLTGGGASGIGAGLPVALILVALGVSGVAVARRRAA